jgi:hypothetical protein
MKILLENHIKRIIINGKKEDYFKFISKKSKLYRFIKCVIDNIKTKNFEQITCQKTDLHIEISININNTDDELSDQSQMVHNYEIDINNLDNWKLIKGTELLLLGPIIDNYGQTFITVGFFQNNLSNIKQLHDIITHCLTIQSYEKMLSKYLKHKIIDKSFNNENKIYKSYIVYECVLFIVLVVAVCVLLYNNL